MFNAFYFDEVAILCFLERSLLFASKLDWEDEDKIIEVGVIVGVIARILATSSSYFFINSKVLLRFLILYH